MKTRIHNLNIFYGYRCNLACDGCFSGSDVVRTAELDPSLEKTLNSLPQLAELFEVQEMVTLVGGEPLLYWNDIVVLCRAIRQHFPGVTINLFTNGLNIDRYTNELIELMLELDPFTLAITRHLDAFIETSTIGSKWKTKLDSFLQDSRIVKIHNEHYHIDNHIHCNIRLRRVDEWRLYYKTSPDGTIKPFATNDPAGSMQHGCPGNVCTAVFENKVYKCPTLATLPGHLKTRGQADDPDWQPYLDYPAIDLDNINPEHWNQFVSTYGHPISQCDMCNNQPQHNIIWIDRDISSVLP